MQPRTFSIMGIGNLLWYAKHSNAVSEQLLHQIQASRNTQRLINLGARVAWLDSLTSGTGLHRSHL